MKKKFWGKVQASLTIQQGQQWGMAYLVQLRQFILQLYNEQHMQHVKDIVLHITTSAQRNWQGIQFHFHNIQWNVEDLYRQLGTLWTNRSIDV